jgi:hypothetical protein
VKLHRRQLRGRTGTHTAGCVVCVCGVCVQG